MRTTNYARNNLSRMVVLTQLKIRFDSNVATKTSDQMGPKLFCYAEGTRLATATDGEIPVEHLTPRHRLVTQDNGFQQPIWVSVTKLKTEDLDTFPNTWPIRIEPGALGEGLPKTTLYVSQQHRMLVRSKIAARMFGQAEVWIAAKHLTALPGIKCMNPGRPISFYHVLMQHHEILFANGAASESLFIGEQSMAIFGKTALEKAKITKPMTPSREIADGQKAAALVRRHLKNKHDLLNRDVTPPLRLAG